MSELIKCPECHHEFELSKVVEKELRSSLEVEFNKKLKEVEKKSYSEANLEVTKLRYQLDESNKREIELRKERTELEQRSKDIDLEVQRKLDEEKGRLEVRVGDRISEAHRLKDAEKDKKISDALAQVDDLKRRIEQGSQQSQGEVLEVELEQMLKAEFPLDNIEPVSVGTKGGDLIHVVNNQSGHECGKILWELKRTKNFSESWIAKLKNDARSAKASICILATETMPTGMDYFGLREGIWISPLVDCIPLSRALRFGLLQIAKEKLMQTGKKEKAEVLYDYLIGIEFRGRIEALVEAYRTMKDDLESERRSMEKIWAKREKQINQVTFNLAGMHGEMEALAGDNLPTIKLLEIGET